ncbi:MAG: thiol peroxidase [Campylobacteraceae bacterium]|nr:thiol peroxidase [Campylobacteraceae bacterium]
MKKFLTFVCLGGLLFAGGFEDNLKESIKNNFKQDVEVISSDKLKSVSGLRLAVLKTAEGNAMPLYVSEDGKSFLAVSDFFYFDSSSDKDLFVGKIDEIRAINQAATEKNEAQKAKLFDSLFEGIPSEAGLLLKSQNKTDELLTIVTDPDCPYCRMELTKLREHLKNTNVRMIFAPVHDETAFIKSALILEEAKKLKDNEKIIAVIEKYYQDVELDEKQLQTKTDVVHGAADAIFGSGLIRGVPYLHNGKLK